MSLEKLKEEAINPQTSLLRLQQIAQTNHDNNELAKLIASNPNTNDKLLEILAIRADKNKDLETQKAIAQNPNTPQEIRQHLTQDSNSIVHAAAREMSQN